MKKIVARINNYEVWVVQSDTMGKFGHKNSGWGIKPLGGSQWIDQSGFIFDSAIEAEHGGIIAARNLKPAVMIKTLNQKILDRIKLSSDGKFKEEEHPRANDGKFGEKGSGESAKEKPKAPAKKSVKKHVDGVHKKAKEKLGDKAKHPKPQFMQRDPDHTKQDNQTQTKSKEPEPNNQNVTTQPSAKQINPDSLDALQDYGDTLYEPMNRFLRSPNSVTNIGSGTLKKVKNAIEHIDSVMANSKLTEDYTVYRGMTDAHSLAEIGENFVGKSIKVPNYWSSSLDKRVSEGFAKGDGSVIFEINLRKGQKAIDMEPYKDATYDDIDEQEMLLPRDTKYKITGYRKSGSTVIYTAEVDNGE